VSTYSTNLKIEEIGTGEQAGTWGTTTNDNFVNVFEEAIVGRVTVSFSDADVTLSATNSVASQSFRNVYLNCTGTNAASRNLIVPTINKNYVVQNNTTGGFNIVVKTTAGTGITVPNGRTCTVYADGTNVIQAFDYLPTLNVPTLNITTLDATNIEVTNIKAKDGTASATIADSTGVMTIGSSVLTTTDINGGTIDGTTIGGASAAAGNFTTLGATGVATFSAGTVSAPAITTTGDTNTGIYFPAADTIAFTEGGVESMRIDSGGNLGIGVTPSAWSGLVGVQVKDRLAFSGFGGNSYITNNSFYGSLGFTYLTTNPTSQLRFSDNIFIFANAASGTAGTAITYAERMRITAAGDVGIGTSSPNLNSFNKELTVSAGTSGTARAGINIQGSRTTDSTFGALSYYHQANLVGSVEMIRGGADNSGIMQFFTANAGTAAERMRITSAGNVGIGTSSPESILHVVSATNTTQLSISNTPTSVATNDIVGAIGFKVNDNNRLTQSTDFAFIRTIATQNHTAAAAGTALTFGTTPDNSLVVAERMRLDSSGNVGIGTSSPTVKLDVSGNVRANLGYDLAADSQGTILSTSSNTLFLDGNAGNVTIRPKLNVGNLILSNAARFQVPTTISVGGAAIQTSGSGIAFPATQSASSDANTLDDYEEGSWNGTVSDGTNNATMSTNGGSYTKVGNLVTVTGYFACSNKASISGNLRVIGLPFTVFNGTAAYAGQAFGYTGGANITAGQNVIGVYAEYNTTYLNLTYWNVSTGTSGLPATAINNNFDFILSLTYRTN
jgi:hypothetical protein